MKAIEVKNLQKFYQVYKKEPGLAGSLKAMFARRYESVKAVDDISFSIEKGELVGFIGPNGAGKTTTLKTLSGLLHPTSGNVEVLGFKPYARKDEFKKSISLVMGQKNSLWWDLPPMETFLLNKEIYDITDKDFKKTSEELIELLNVQDILHIQTKKLSLGQRMKCELIASLIHQPKVLFLDEPTIGLDVVMQKVMRDFIQEYNRRYNATIILTSHYMEDVKQLAKRVIVIDHGKLLFDGQLSEIVKKFADYKVLTVDFTKDIDQKKIKNLGEVMSYAGRRVVISVPKEKIAHATEKLFKDFAVEDLTVEEPDIEDIIRELFAQKKV
jgi:ABC-2 type transport system ATP-binding protein